MRQRIKAYIFAGMFLGMMILPGLLFIPLKDYVDTENYENRVYQEKPVLNFRNLSAADLKSYPGQYDAYFNDHLAFKNPIVAFWKTGGHSCVWGSYVRCRAYGKGRMDVL